MVSPSSCIASGTDMWTWSRTHRSVECPASRSKSMEKRGASTNVSSSVWISTASSPSTSASDVRSMRTFIHGTRSVNGCRIASCSRSVIARKAARSWKYSPGAVPNPVKSLATEPMNWATASTPGRTQLFKSATTASRISVSVEGPSDIECGEEMLYAAIRARRLSVRHATRGLGAPLSLREQVRTLNSYVIGAGPKTGERPVR